MRKYLPLALATAAIVATQITCTFVVVRDDERVNEVFVDHVQQLVYDGQVVRADLGRAWVADAERPTPGETETRTVGRLVLTRDATLELHQRLAELLAVVHRPPAEPVESGTSL